MTTPSELDTIAEITRLGKTTKGGICLCCGQVLNAESRAMNAEGALRSLAGKGPKPTPPIAEAIGAGTILEMGKQAAEVIRNTSILLHVTGKMPDDVYRQMIANANQIREDALRLEGWRPLGE
jgi:hypothetical protein